MMTETEAEKEIVGFYKVNKRFQKSLVKDLVHAVNELGYWVPFSKEVRITYVND